MPTASCGFEGRARDGEAYVQRIHERFTYRMNDLSEFMKTLLQRFTRWHNARTKRRGNLWEETFKSVVVEDGPASKTIAANIDLNPVRAGMVADPAEYRWSSYGAQLATDLWPQRPECHGIFPPPWRPLPPRAGT